MDQSFATNLQQDVTEFIIAIFYHLSTYFNSTSYSSSIIDSNFKYCFKEIYRCKDCSNEIIFRQSNYILNIRFDDNTNTEQHDLFDLVNKVFEGESRDLICETCKSEKSHIMAKAELENAPKYMLMAISRFKHRYSNQDLDQDIQISKIEDSVELLADIDFHFS